MSATIPTTEPEFIRAGETLEWTKTNADYPASDGWSFIYYLSGPDDITITAGTYNTTDYLVSEDAAVTALWTYGIYTWELYAESYATGSLVKKFIESGFVTIKSSAGKSFAKTMLDAIEATLAGRATSKDLDLISKNIGGTGFSRNPDNLMKYRDKFRAEYLSEVSSENRSQGKGSGNKIRVRFRSA